MDVRLHKICFDLDVSLEDENRFQAMKEDKERILEEKYPDLKVGFVYQRAFSEVQCAMFNELHEKGLLTNEQYVGRMSTLSIGVDAPHPNVEQLPSDNPEEVHIKLLKEDAELIFTLHNHDDDVHVPYSSIIRGDYKLTGIIGGENNDILKKIIDSDRPEPVPFLSPLRAANFLDSAIQYNLDNETTLLPFCRHFDTSQQDIDVIKGVAFWHEPFIKLINIDNENVILEKSNAYEMEFNNKTHESIDCKSKKLIIIDDNSQVPSTQTPLNKTDLRNAIMNYTDKNVRLFDERGIELKTTPDLSDYKNNVILDENPNAYWRAHPKEIQDAYFKGDATQEAYITETAKVPVMPADHSNLTEIDSSNNDECVFHFNNIDCTITLSKSASYSNSYTITNIVGGEGDAMIDKLRDILTYTNEYSLDDNKTPYETRLLFKDATKAMEFLDTIVSKGLYEKMEKTSPEIAKTLLTPFYHEQTPINYDMETNKPIDENYWYGWEEAQRLGDGPCINIVNLINGQEVAIYAQNTAIVETDAESYKEDDREWPGTIFFVNSSQIKENARPLDTDLVINTFHDYCTGWHQAVEYSDDKSLEVTVDNEETTKGDISGETHDDSDGYDYT